LLFVRRSEFLTLGGFDLRYFLYGEDVDLSRRYRMRGLPIRLTEALVGEHSGGGSSIDPHETLRIAPLAWSVLGTLEYLSIWSGSRTAARAARAALVSIRVQRGILAQVRRLGFDGRVARKSQQIAGVENFLMAHAREVEPEYCPGARDALRAALGGLPR
jgi:GT2 family glycosyltransferase